MPGSVVSAFSQPADFAKALHAEGVRSLVVAVPGQFQARLTQISLDQVHLAAGEEQLPRIAFVVVPADTLIILFPVGAEASPICGGVAARPGELMMLHPTEQLYARTHSASRWATIRLSADMLVSCGIALTGAAFCLPPTMRCWRPKPTAARQLRVLHAAAIRMAAKNPQMLLATDAVHGLEQQLLQAAVECLPSQWQGSPPGVEHEGTDLMLRFEETFREGRKHLRPVRDICSDLRISAWRLRRLCAQHLGMSPGRYTRLRLFGAAGDTPLKHGPRGL